MTVYVMGANVPGHSPESEPVYFDSEEDARAALYDEAVHACDRLADAYGEWPDVVERAVNETDWIAEANCEWFAGCDRPADVVVDHPILGGIPSCQRCQDRMS